MASSLDMGCWGGTTQHLGRNVPELGAERPWADRLRGGSTGTRGWEWGKGKEGKGRGAWGKKIKEMKGKVGASKSTTGDTKCVTEIPGGQK